MNNKKKRIKLKYKNIILLILIIIIQIIVIYTVNINNNKNEIATKIKISKKQFHKKIKNNELNKLNYNKSIEITEEILKNINSDPSIIIVDSKGNVLAHRKENDRREGASTSKIFVGYAALKLLNKEDKIIGTEYSIKECSPYCNNKINIGEELNVIKAATYVFPDSANSVATDISIAIGKKYYNADTEEKNARLGIEKINNYLKEIGCTNTHLGNANGLNTTPTDNDNNFDKITGYPTENCIDGISANDLALVTVKAMTNNDFSNEIKNNLDDGIYYIKSGRGYLCHGVWGFNYINEKYYIILLGTNCNLDDRTKIINELYNWSTNELIKEN